MDREELQLMAQMIENVDQLSRKLEEFHSKDDRVNFLKVKNEILSSQRKISEMIG
tara:strand:- start:1041 stop:1205 length:165 start_codon:yes stop_codon:yes gene_type:complete